MGLDLHHKVRGIDVYLAVVILSTGVYIISWSYISIQRFLSLNAYVYDAGLFMQEWYDVVAVHWTLLSFWLSFSSRGIKFFLFPLILLNNIQIVLVFQTIMIAICSPILYYVALSRGIRKLLAMILSLCYLIFFPLAGANFFDLHNLTLFPAFLLIGYYFSLRGKPIPSILGFSFASITKYPLSGVVAIFCFFLIVDLFLEDKSETYLLKKRKLIAYLISLVFSITMFVARYASIIILYHSYVIGDIHTSGYFGPVLSNTDVLLTILILFGPLLFLPLLSIRSLPLSIGYVALLAHSKFWGYGYPYGLTVMYLFILTPFLFIGTIEVLSGRTYLRFVGSIKFHHSNHCYIRHYSLRGIRLDEVIVAFICIAIITLAILFQPYGPLNGSVQGTDFNLKSSMSVNMTEFNEVLTLVSTIPRGDPYVVVQNGLPEFFPRTFNINGNPMNTPGILEVPGVGGGLPYNLSYQNAQGKWEKIRIDYVVADPYQIPSYYESLAYPYNLSMYEFIKEIYGDGHYGLWAEVNGMVVLKHNYSGALRAYVPFDKYISAKKFNSAFIKGRNVSTLNLHSGVDEWIHMWKTPSFPISPGIYEINMTYAYQYDQNHSGDYNLIVSESGNTIQDAYSYNLNSTSLGPPNVTNTLHLIVNVRNFTDAFTVFAQINPNSSWLGYFNVSGISIHQISAPAVTGISGNAIQTVHLLSKYYCGSSELIDFCLKWEHTLNLWRYGKVEKYSIS